ncbi:unnamed protein product [Cercospora beticola]|nr:unnamed protein product [Cercospora beticola]
MPPPPGTPNVLEGPGDYTMTQKVFNDSYPFIDPTKANLTGKSVFITGASKGLGQQIAISFGKAGASQIAIGARSSLTTTSNLIKSSALAAGHPEPQILPVNLDIASRTSVSAAAELISNGFSGKLDILINNAGMMSSNDLIGSSNPETWWDETMNVNLQGTYLMTGSFLPLLLASSTKTLINISSVGAHLVNPTLSAYQISKLAVLRLTEFVAAEYADQGLVAIAVHPGNILTDIVGNGEGMDEGLKAVFTETPRLCADSLVFLCKEQREWLSGRYVNCTWDLEELVSEEKKKEIVERDKLKVKLVV